MSSLLPPGRTVPSVCLHPQPTKVGVRTPRGGALRCTPPGRGPRLGGSLTDGHPSGGREHLRHLGGGRHAEQPPPGQARRVRPVSAASAAAVVGPSHPCTVRCGRTGTIKNGRPAFLKDNDTNHMLWFAHGADGPTWYVGKREEFGESRGWLQVKSDLTLSLTLTHPNPTPTPTLTLTLTPTLTLTLT